MRIIYLVTVFTATFLMTASAQFNETIRTGRPGQAIGAFTTGHKIFQVQSGVDYFSSKNTGLNLKTEGYLSNTVMRMGLTEPFELSALIEYRNETITDTETNEKTQLSGFSAIDFGMRYHIFSGKGLVPNIGFQIRMRLPILGEDYEIKDMAPRFIIVTSQRLSETFTLISNIGASWNGIDGSPTGTYVFNLSFPFNDKFGAFVESFGGLRQGVLTSNIDTGFAYLISNDFQLDVYGGYGNNLGVKDFFVSLGISVRTKRNEQKEQSNN